VFKKLLLIVLLSYSLFALDTIYFLPDQAKEAKTKIIDLIENAKSSVDVAMYSIDEKDFTKALKKAAKNGVEVTLIYGKSKLKFYKKINLIETKRKQHIKLAIIDNKIAIFGSANWKKESFKKNYEIINITDESHKVKRFQGIFQQIKQEN
jgi:phosphatidylserine/phosphatidylglycerophosphate/cardiolipin synthase-like enzyme